MIPTVTRNNKNAKSFHHDQKHLNKPPQQKANFHGIPENKHQIDKK